MCSNHLEKTVWVNGALLMYRKVNINTIAIIVDKCTFNDVYVTVKETSESNYVKWM